MNPGEIPGTGEIADRLAILDLLARHSRGLDRRHLATLQGSYWPDATVDYGSFKGAAHEFAAIVLPGLGQAISDESEYAIRDKVNAGGYEVNSTPFDLGEVSFHSGWCFHRAGPNTTGTERKVMTVIYMDQDMTLKTPEHDRQKGDWEKWVPGVEVGAVCDSPLNPVLWNRWS